MAKKTENGTISLQPFIHQVGGHSSMLCLDEATVCKPVVERERLFYETLPDCLRSFVPIYYGVVEGRLIQDGDYVTFSATSPEKYKPQTSSNMKRVRLRRSGSVEVEEGGTARFDSDSVLADETAVMNPWVGKCLKEFITSVITRLEQDPQPLNFIVLENLTWRFNLPCILDLKMGTRQHGDDDNLAKRQSKMVKVVSTTSAKLGVRIGGMQVYQASSGKFLCKNKLYGRTLTAAGFQAALRSFLDDGTRLRTDALPPLIRRLEELQKTLAHLESNRFYTTSLLLLYEGHRYVNGELVNNPRVRQSKGDERQPKAGQNECRERSERANSVDRQGDSLQLPGDFRNRTTSCNTRERKHFRPVETAEEEPLTDVRIIDFAHSTHPAMEDKVLYSGPDTGFLFGLGNMIQLLKAILADSQ